MPVWRAQRKTSAIQHNYCQLWDLFSMLRAKIARSGIKLRDRTPFLRYCGGFAGCWLSKRWVCQMRQLRL